MDTPIYSGYKTSNGSVVTATRPDAKVALPNLGRFCSERFDWGCGGNGPKDLARSIIGHYLSVDEPCDRMAAAVWHDITAQLPDRAWSISAKALNETLRNTTPGRWAVALGRTVSTFAVHTDLGCHEAGIAFVELCLALHKQGDWGALDSDDIEANRDAVFSGARIVSAYPIPDYLTASDNPACRRLYVVTDATDDNGHRLATTVCYSHEV